MAIKQIAATMARNGTPDPELRGRVDNWATHRPSGGLPDEQGRASATTSHLAQSIWLHRWPRDRRRRGMFLSSRFVRPGSAVVHLIGYPGAGKYTVARCLADAAESDGRRYVVVDNHHTANVVFAVVDVDDHRPVTSEVWDRVGEVREALYRTIETLSPPDWSFVFTNVLSARTPEDEAIVARLAALAARRRSVYVPVVLTCERAELLRRAATRDRQERMKMTDPTAVAAFVDNHELLDVSEYGGLRIDLTAVEPEVAAHRTLEYVDGLVTS